TIMDTSEKTIFGNLGHFVQRSVSLKLITIFILMLLLLIPVQFIIQLINEREFLQQSAILEVSSKWGNSQKVYGPVLTIPFIEKIQEEGKIKEVKNEAYFLPSFLNISGNVSPQKLNRGIYEVVVYDSHVTLSGSFNEISKYISDLDEAELLWEEAFLRV